MIENSIKTKPSSPVSELNPNVRWVLIAEDDDDIREMLKDSICREAHLRFGQTPIQVIEVRDGQEALRETSLRQFHCVVTDLKMPKSTGDQFIRGMQTQILNATTPTLVISAHGQSEFKTFCEQYSHIHVIPKPFEPLTVAQAVINEIKLGRMDSRIPIHLMNPFIQSIDDFLKLELGVTGKIEIPEIKKVGTQLGGEYHCNLNIGTVLNRTRFNLSFEKKFVDWAKTEYFKKRFPETAALTSEDVVRNLVQIVVERTTPNLSACLGETPRLSGLSIITNKNEAESTELKSLNGVHVQITTDKGSIIASALAYSKKARGQLV